MITLSLINLCVDNVVKKGNQYRIVGEGKSILAKKVVLGIGSPPPKAIWSTDLDKVVGDDVLLISNPYEPNLNDTLAEIKSFTEKRVNLETNVLIIGANASALELLYKLNDLKDNEVPKINKFLFLSTLGLVPDSIIDEEAKNNFRPTHLMDLKSHQSLSAKTIAEAAFADLDLAEEMNIGAATSIVPISQAFGSLLSHLDREELENFACFYGNEIGRRQRCAGTHYSEVVEKLKKEHKFQHLAGRYMNIVKRSDNDFVLEYHKTSLGKAVLDSNSLNIIINCIGSEQLNSKTLTPLYDNLISSGICTPNKSFRGFTVNERLEASPNFHIAGPLLAGNVLEGRALWHLEHCGRIIWSSNLIAQQLADFYVNVKAV